MPLLDLIVGARPNFVKIAALTRALDAHRRGGGALRYRLVHTGQHYAPELSDSFFDDLAIPRPDHHLEVGSGSPAAQTGAIMERYEALIRSAPADATVVVGDVTSTMACAITAQKCGVPVAHVEAGIRSGDWRMPEEINRLVTDAISNWFFTTSEWANRELARTGVPSQRVFFVGNTMIDTLLLQLPHLRPPAFFTERALVRGEFLVVTLHRPANVDDDGRRARLLSCIASAAAPIPVIFPAHPRTLLRMSAGGTPPPASIILTPALPYHEFNWLVKNATGVLTDSGGVTEETTVLGVPCATLRDSTERPETTVLGTNVLVGGDQARIEDAVIRMRRREWKRGTVPPLWDGRAGQRIVEHLVELVAAGGRQPVA